MPSRDQQQLTFNFKSSELTLPCLSRQISRRPKLEGKLVPKKSQVSKLAPGRRHKNALLTLIVVARALWEGEENRIDLPKLIWGMTHRHIPYLYMRFELNPFRQRCWDLLSRPLFCTGSFTYICLGPVDDGICVPELDVGKIHFVPRCLDSRKENHVLHREAMKQQAWAATNSESLPSSCQPSLSRVPRTW